MNTMNSIGLAQDFSYLEAAVALVSLAAAIILFFLWQKFLATFKSLRAAAAFILLSRISLPAIFLLVAFVLKLPILRQTFALGPRFYQCLNAVIIFLSVFFLIRLAEALLLYRFQKQNRPFPVPRVLRGFILATIYLVVLFTVLKGILGVNITPFLATSAIFTAILGLAFQGVLSNVLAGISLNMTKSFGRGDWVKVGPHEGVVLDTNWRETLLLDRASNVVVIPNSTVASEMIINFSHPDQKTALTIPLKIGYNASPAVVVDVLRQAAREVQGVLSSPPPDAFILSFDDFGVSYVVKFWITDFARKHPLTGEVARHIWSKFQRENIEIAVPLTERVRDVVRAFQPEEAARGAEVDKERTTEDLLRSSLFRYQEGEKTGQLLVADEEIRELASSVRRKRYTAGEVLFRQGDRGESCYIVARGSIRGEIISEEKGKKYASEFTIGPG
ncbi:MAG: mechanosensitive ion channel domain-containing protein, partial [Acidobacteriota bacterium]